MPTKLTTTIEKASLLPNKTNAEVAKAFLGYMRQKGSSERHQNNQLKTAVVFGIYLGRDKTFLEIRKKEEIIAFLDTKIKPEAEDPEKKWITTWNDYLHRLKRFFRWLHSQYGKEESVDEVNWGTPEFVKIRQKRTKRLSPYSETDIWDRDELMTLVKYAFHIRDKAALSLLWDLDARNHEVTLLKIKDIRLRERYGEGAIPDTAKTGSGPILLTISFPYVRDWLQVHPDKDNPEARLICSLNDGSAIEPDALWQLMHERLKPKIRQLLESGRLTDKGEREKLEYLLKTKKFNPYCIRHSAITYDGDSLPEFALRKKVRWSMNSRQPARYMKKRMGNNLKNQILAREGIVLDDALKEKPAVIVCPKCGYVNALEEKACSKCDWPFSSKVNEQIKAEQKQGVEALREQLRETQERQDRKITQILNLVRQNPKLANVKPELLGDLEIRAKG